VSSLQQAQVFSPTSTYKGQYLVNAVSNGIKEKKAIIFLGIPGSSIGLSKKPA
jgi:hypothetical protein